MNDFDVNTAGHAHNSNPEFKLCVTQDAHR